MAYYNPNLHVAYKADLSTAVVPSDLTMDKFGQLVALRPTYADSHTAIFYEKADIAMLCERIGFDVPVDQLRRMEVRQDRGMLSLHVEFATDAAKDKFFAEHGKEHLHKAAESLVQRADESFVDMGELELPTEPFIDSRGKLRMPDDVRRARYEHAASQNESTRDSYAKRLGPPSMRGDTWDGVYDNAQGPRSVRDMQRLLVGDPEPLVKKIQDRADRSKDLPKREGTLLREKKPRTPEKGETHLGNLIKRDAQRDTDKGRS